MQDWRVLVQSTILGNRCVRMLSSSNDETNARSEAMFEFGTGRSAFKYSCPQQLLMTLLRYPLMKSQRQNVAADVRCWIKLPHAEIISS